MVFFKRKSFWKTTSIILGVYLFIFSSFFISFYFFDLIKYVQVYSAELAYKYPNSFNFKIWQITTANGFSEKYLRSKSIPANIANFHGLNSAYEDGREIMDYAEDNNLNINFALANKFKEKYYLDVDFESVESDDQNFVSGLTYKFPGVLGKENYERENLFLEKPNQLNYRILNNDYLNTQDPITEEIFKGTMSERDSSDSVVRNANLLLTSINNKENLEESDLLIPQESSDLSALTEEHTQNLWVKTVNFEKDKILETDKNDYFIVGSTVFYIGNCSKEVSIELYYSSSLKQYKFGDISNLIKSLCLKPVASLGIEYASCLDCTYFPVDKNHALQSFYAPYVSQMTALESDFSISVDAFEDFVNMFNDAKAAGHNVQITSAYRSYANQQETFQYWVSAELEKGMSQEDAEINANRYSARPGFSEHQLGTTVDLNSKDCDAFAAYCQANEDFWLWLHDNAHKYGFVMSYPEHQEAVTGYIYEPWHYRWLGLELAKKYKEQEGILTLNQWLMAKGLY